MIIIKGGGRLGNQVFQYAFLKNLLTYKNFVIAFEWKELLELFELEDKILAFERKTYFRGCSFFCWHSMNYIFKLIGKTKIFSYYEQVNGNSYLKRGGVFKNINFINYGNYQSEKFFSPKIREKLKIKKKYLDKAKCILEPFIDKELVFVHIRRGDYVRLGGNLPKSYYEKGIEYFQNKLNNPFFIFLSDDIEWGKENFKLKNAYYSNNDLYIDFTLMTLCEYGIMSNSTFSYWGGYLMQNRKEVFFPKYWLGFKEKKYSPIGIKPSWAREIEVD